jgi:hypothetical protein
MIDELGHETALPSLLGTNRAGLGEFGVDLAMAALKGKSSAGIKFSADHRAFREGLATHPEVPSSGLRPHRGCRG